MKKHLLKLLGLYPIGYEQPCLNNPKDYLREKGIETSIKQQKTLTTPVGKSLSSNEVFHPRNFK